MGLTADLTSYASLLRASGWHANQHISLNANETVLAGTLSGDPSGNPFAQFSYTASEGDYADVEAGMTLLVSETNDRRAAFFRGRVRSAPTSSVMYHNETSEDLESGDYFWVLRDFQVQEKLARVSGSTYYKDWDATFRALPPSISGLQSCYANWVDADGVYEIPFTAVGAAMTYGATVSAYAWTFPAGSGSVTAGATNAASVTYAFNPGEWWPRVVVTDSNGLSTTFHFKVFAHDGDHPPAYGFDGADIRGNLQGGWNASVAAFDGVDDVLDQTLCCIWTARETHGSTQGSLVSTVNFVGRLRQENTPTRAILPHSTLAEARFEIEGPLAQLARIPSPLITMRHDATPAAWDEINRIDVQRAIWHVLREHTTFTELHSLSISALAQGHLMQLCDTPDGSTLNAVNEIASAINGVFEMDAQGRARLARDACYLDDGDRDALTTIFAFTSADWSEIQVQRDHTRTVNQVEASGGVYNTTSNVVTPLLSIAPGLAHAAGGDEAQLAGQVLAGNATETSAQTELNARAGRCLAAKNPKDTLRVTLRDGFHLLTPSREQWYTFTYGTADNVRGLAYSAQRWLLTELQHAHDNKSGGRVVNAVFERETDGPPGQTYTLPTTTLPTVTVPTIPVVRPVSTVPTSSLPTKLIALMGNGHVAIATSYSHPTAPDWQDATGAMTGDCGSPGGGNNEGGYLYEDLWYPARYWVSNSDGLWVNEDPFGGSAWSLQNNNALLCGVRKLIQSIRQPGWMAALVAEGAYGGGRVIYSTDNFATIAGTVPYPTASSTYYDITVAQGGRATGAGSGVQLFLLERYVPAPWNLYIVYSGDGGASVARRGTPGRDPSGFTPPLVSKFGVPVFRNDGSWNTDGDLLYVGAQVMSGATSDVYQSEDGGTTFAEFYSDWSLRGNFANVAAGAMQDNRYQAWILQEHATTNDRRIFFSGDYGASWYQPPDLGVNANRIRFSDCWAGVNGYSYHTNWFVWWRNQNVLTTPDIFVTDDVGESASSIQGSGATNIFTVTGQGTGSGSFPNIIAVQADISDTGWLFAPGA